MLTLEWIRCTGHKWCPLEQLNLTSLGEVCGVYVIWHGGNNAKTVRVGQGAIAERLGFQLKNPDVMKYSNLGLFVTWAKVPESQLDGVELYLSGVLSPLTGDRWPDAIPIPVNSPFS